MFGRLILLAIAIVLILLVLPAFYTIGTTAKPGAYIVLKIYSTTSTGMFVDETRLLAKPGIYFYVGVAALTPPTQANRIVVVHEAFYNSSNIAYIPLDKLYTIAKAWLETGKTQNTTLKSPLLIRVVVFNATEKRELYGVEEVVYYNPLDILENRTLTYTVYLTKPRIVESTTLPKGELAREVPLEEILKR